MLSLSGDQRQSEHVSLNVVEGSAETDSMIEIRGVAGGSLSDTVRRPIHVSPAGYPARESLAGVLNERAKIQLPIPRDMVDGSLAVTVRAFPSPLADVMSGIESILREPHGCFGAEINFGIIGRCKCSQGIEQVVQHPFKIGI